MCIRDRRRASQKRRHCSRTRRRRVSRPDPPLATLRRHRVRRYEVLWRGHCAGGWRPLQPMCAPTPCRCVHVSGPLDSESLKLLVCTSFAAVLHALECSLRCVRVAAMVCPDDVYMCEDPGLLLCVGDLNDCSGRGDCLKGSCYCHLGWGGDDCSVEICLPATGCPNVRPPSCHCA